jgi:TnpA family transposase
VLLPGVTTLERLVARVRARVAERLWRELTRGLVPEQQAQLEALLIVREGERQSPLDRLRQGPVLRSGRELARAVRRLAEIQELVQGLPGTGRLPRSRVLSLARFAAAAKAQTISRMPKTRRIATLLAFVRTLEASAGDDVLDLFDVVVSKLLADAAKAEQQARLRSLRDLDQAALVLRHACAPLFDPAVAGDAVRTVAFTAVPAETVRGAMERVDSLVRPADEPRLDTLVASYRGVSGFLPALARTVRLQANASGRSVLAALAWLRDADAKGVRREPPPCEFVPRSWMAQVAPGGQVNRKAWTVCLAERARHALRRRDLYAAPSLRYADPRLGLLDGTAWDAARPVVCRTLDRSQDGATEVARLAEQLDRAYRATALGLAGNPDLRIELGMDGKPDISVAALDKQEEPASLVELRALTTARLPRLDLPELLLEMQARTGFVDAFTHASEAGSRVGELALSISAVLVAEACNTGFEPLAQPDVPALRRARLSWVKHNYLRADTLTAANARLVAAQAAIPLARAWGGGDVASADGLRFVVPVRTVHAGPNPRYFGQGRGVTYYNLIADQYTGLGGIVVPGTLRDSLVLLAVVLEQETPLEPVEIMSDAGAYTDTIFGIFWLLGYQFSPRLADVGGARFWRTDRRADYGPLDGLARHRVNTKLIVAHWDDLLRLAGSLKLGLVQAGGVMRTLQTRDRPTRLAQALAELGRMVKSLYLLSYVGNAAERRRILVQLNRHEGRHDLSRAVFHARRGELRQRYREGQEDQLGALGLVVNMIVLWNSLYMDAALAQLRAEGYSVRDEDVARLSPLAFRHVNMLGRYAFTLPEAVARGELRPLRDPRRATDDDPE